MLVASRSYLLITDSAHRSLVNPTTLVSAKAFTSHAVYGRPRHSLNPFDRARLVSEGRQKKQQCGETIPLKQLPVLHRRRALILSSGLLSLSCALLTTKRDRVLACLPGVPALVVAGVAQDQLDAQAPDASNVHKWS